MQPGPGWVRLALPCGKPRRASTDTSRSYRRAMPRWRISGMKLALFCALLLATAAGSVSCASAVDPDDHKIAPVDSRTERQVIAPIN